MEHNPPQRRAPGRPGHRAGLAALLLLAGAVELSMGQTVILVEDFEFASSDAAAAAGVIDITSPANQPTFYISGKDENASPNEPGGLFSIGTDSVFCLQACVPGSFIGFKRLVDPARWPSKCGTQHYIPLRYTYGDSAHPGPVAPDFPLSSLKMLCDLYGNGSFADGLLATHFWVNLIDCEGEVFEYVNFAEPSLWSELWTFDVPMGKHILRLSPQSLLDVPHGDRLLTEIAAIEVLIQDEDDPPTTVGKWYIDYLRVIEPAAPLAGDVDGDGDVDLNDYMSLPPCFSGPTITPQGTCLVFDLDGDNDVDLRDVALFARAFTGSK